MTTEVRIATKTSSPTLEELVGNDWQVIDRVATSPQPASPRFATLFCQTFARHDELRQYAGERTSTIHETLEGLVATPGPTRMTTISFHNIFESFVRLIQTVWPFRGLPANKTRPGEETPIVPVEPEELLNWDMFLESSPPRPSGTITVKLDYAGRDHPFPMGDPNND